jgi:ribosome-associated protein
MKKPVARQSRKRPAEPRLPADLMLGITAALDKKALDLSVLDLRPASAFTDYFVICTGANARQVQAIAEAVQGAIGARGVKPSLVEGLSRADWVLIDYFDFIFHVFTPATRNFYGLERLWGDAQHVDVPA